jgi:hypothetical protein
LQAFDPSVASLSATSRSRASIIQKPASGRTQSVAYRGRPAGR